MVRDRLVEMGILRKESQHHHNHFASSLPRDFRIYHHYRTEGNVYVAFVDSW